MSRLPSVGGDDNSWGTILNDYLSVSLNGDGTLKSSALPTASSSTPGIVQLATTAEATTGTDTAKAVTAAGVKAVGDTKAALSHTHAGTDITSGIVPATYLPTTSSSTLGIVQLATTTEATTGTNTTKAITPAGLKTVADTKVGGDGITSVKLVTTAPDPASQVAGTLYVVQGTTTTWAATPASTTVAGIVELATPAETITGTDTTRAVTPAGVDAAIIVGSGPITLTDNATIATDASLSNYFRVTIAGNRTLGIPTNPTDGQKALWEITASGAARTISPTTGSTGSFKFGSDFSTIPTIASGTTTFIGAIYRTSSARWHILSVAQGH